MPFPARNWDVLIIGGASGVGKASVSYRLAHHFGIGITEIDDFQVMLECMTTPEQLPAIHFWRTHPAPLSLPAEVVFDRLLNVGTVLTPGLEAVIANHLRSRAPVVLEGDFVHPALGARSHFRGEAHGGRVRAVFLMEPDERQSVANDLPREPQEGP